MLMTEQSSGKGGISTYYSGSRAQFVLAGIPNDLFPTTKKATAFRLNPGDSCWFGGDVPAFLMRTELGYDLEIQWGYKGPYKCAHPALQALAHAMSARLRELTFAADFYSRRDVPLEKLAAARPHFDYITNTPVVFGDEFHKSLTIGRLSSSMWHDILSGEILPDKAPSTPASDAQADQGFQKLMRSISDS
ncbi:hypothetical protein [Rhizobacter fulvus]